MRSTTRKTLQELLASTVEVHHLEYALEHGVRALQTESGLIPDGVLGPLTRAVIDARTEAVAATPAAIPAGKGVFVRNLGVTGEPEDMLARMTGCGLEWVAIQRSWQYLGDKATTIYNRTSVAAYAEPLIAAGREVWLWGYPVPGKHEEFAADLVEAAIDVRATGVLVDAELPFIGQRAAAQQLMDRLLPAARGAGLAVGLTSYGAPKNFPSFPWSEFTGVDFGVPQIYDAKRTMPPEYPADAVAAWRALGYPTLVPASAAFNRDADGMTDLLARTPTPAGALVWWDWWNLEQSPGRWQAVQAYTPRAG